MKRDSLTPGEMARARTQFYRFAFLNIISFTLLAGNILSLFALKMGGGNFLIGLISSFIYLSYLFMLAGRLLVPRLGMVRLMGSFWRLRYLAMLPIVLAPLLYSRKAVGFAHVLIVACVFGFNAARGVAITGYNPIVGAITDSENRGGFLARLQALQHSATLGLSVLLAFLLGRDAPLWRYSAFIIVGTLSGVAAAAALFKLPEPPDGSLTPGLTKIWSGLKQAWRRASFKRFILIHAASSLATFMITPFLVVYIKQVYLQPDNIVILLTVSGSLGALTMALASGFMIDKLGAKPLYFIFSAILMLTLIPMIFSPPFTTAAGLLVFAALIFFFQSMGQFGILNAAQTYFFGVIRPDERLDLGVVFFLAQGLSGGIGSFVGGILLERFVGFYPAEAAGGFKLYFTVTAGFTVIVLFLITTLENLGAYPIRDALGVIFSPRDLRAISLLHRLRKSRTLGEERSTIQAIGESTSTLSIGEIESKLRSPRFSIRAQALETLRALPRDERIAPSLISEVKNHSFTTAYMAADILGQKGFTQGIPALRKALHSRDVFLSGKSMLALARLDDRESIPEIEKLLTDTRNPRLMIHAASALEEYKNPGSLPVLLGKLPPKAAAYIRDELIFSVAGILGLGDWFYPHYTAFVERGLLGISHLEDTVRDQLPEAGRREAILRLLAALPQRDREHFARLAAELLAELAVVLEGVDVSALLARAISDPRFQRLDRFCFLLAAAVVWFAAAGG
jgi:Na+/melibiose symporter-like transporter